MEKEHNHCSVQKSAMNTRTSDIFLVSGEHSGEHSSAGFHFFAMFIKATG
jgi:hypothetical protein